VAVTNVTVCQKFGSRDMGKIAETVVKGKGTRTSIPKAAKLYFNLEGGERLEWLTTTTDLTEEDLADNCLIVRVVRKK